MWGPEQNDRPAEPKQATPKVTLIKCRCQAPMCKCRAQTPHRSGICYSCRGGEGVAFVPFPPAHRYPVKTAYEVTE